MMQNLYIHPYDNQFPPTFITRPENHLQTNKQLINLLYTDVKNVMSIFRVSRVYPRAKLEKLYLYKIIASYIFSTSFPDNHLHTNKQLINLRYNSVKNVFSVLNCYIGPKCVSSKNDAKALYISE